MSISALATLVTVLNLGSTLHSDMQNPFSCNYVTVATITVAQLARQLLRLTADYVEPGAVFSSFSCSRSLANFSAPTVLLRKAAHKVCNVGLLSFFSHVLSISLRQCCALSGLSDLIFSSVPSSSSSCSPRSYQWWEMSIRSSYTFFSLTCCSETAGNKHMKLHHHICTIYQFTLTFILSGAQ